MLVPFVVGVKGEGQWGRGWDEIVILSHLGWCTCGDGLPLLGGGAGWAELDWGHGEDGGCHGIKLGVGGVYR